MNFKSSEFAKALPMYSVILASIIGMMGCGGSSNGGDNKQGFVKFYNSAKNAPEVILTIDEDLSDKSDGHLEITFSGIAYTKSLSDYELDEENYFYELAWQDEDSSDRDDLNIVAEGQVAIEDDAIQLLVLSESIEAAQVELYRIDVIDDDNDADDDLFNLRFLSMHSDSAGVDVYMSESDETFNEAELVGQLQYKQLSDNKKFAQDEYIFYITASGSQEILYQSGKVDYAYPAQYVMVVRENTGSGDSPYAIDRLSSSSVVEYLDTKSNAKFRTYNGVTTHNLLTNYDGNFDVFVNGVDDNAEISSLNFGEYSELQEQEKGDYSLDLVVAGTEESILSNHLLSLPENSNKTVFFYLKEEDVDEDGDGDVDENGDGIVDEVEVTVHSLVVDNSMSESIYDHQISMINLVDSDDFNVVRFYFVRSDETIDSAFYNRTVGYAQQQALRLVNNTYQVFAVAEVDSSDIILSSFELVLNEESNEMFVIAEADTTAASGYRLVITDQTPKEK